MPDVLPELRGMRRFKMFRSPTKRLAPQASEAEWRQSVGTALGRNVRNADREATRVGRSDLRRQGAVAGNWRAFKATRNTTPRFASGGAVGRRTVDVTDPVAKGFLTQSTKPVIARTTAAAGRLAARPTGNVVAKADVSKLGMMGAAKLVPKIAGAGWKAGRTGMKPKLPLHAAQAAMGSGHAASGLRAVGTGARLAGQNPGLAGLGTGVVGGSVLGYAAHQNKDVVKLYAEENGREWRTDDGNRGKGTYPIPGQAKRVRRFSIGNVGKALDEKQAARLYRVRARLGRQAAGTQQAELRDNSYRNFQTYLARRDGAAPRAARKRGIGNNELFEHMDRKNRELRNVGKAYGDPEDARYFRLGAGSAVLAGGGLAGLAAGGRQIARDTSAHRNRFEHLQERPVPTKVEFDPVTHAGNKSREAKARNYENARRFNEAVRDAKKVKGKGIVLRGRAAGLVGGGAAALGGAELLRRRASERRYN